MEQISWRPKYTQDYAYASTYTAKELNYTCKKCGHEFKEASNIPYRCPDCQVELPNLTTLMGTINQDNRVKHYVFGA